jgi:hypothetical protein
MGTKSNIHQMNSYLRGEISAVETYKMALEKIDYTSPLRADVEANLRSHEERVVMLRDCILQLGGDPATSSGPWGVFAKAVEGTARTMGDKMAISALEEGEDHGVADYKRGLDDLDPDSRVLVTSQLMPLQQQSHSRMSGLKHRLS